MSQKLGKTEQTIIKILSSGSQGLTLTEPEIRRKLKRKSPIYTELNRLLNKRLITKAKLINTSKRQKTGYYIPYTHKELEIIPKMNKEETKIALK